MYKKKHFCIVFQLHKRIRDQKRSTKCVQPQVYQVQANKVSDRIIQDVAQIFGGLPLARTAALLCRSNYIY